MTKPNVLFLFSDQHNARCLSCAGHSQVKMPHLDRLASEGVRFEHAYANNPICTPSRVSYLSGLYPSTHGYYGLYGPQPEARMTSLFSYFKEQGYRTGALGKLHTPRYWIEPDCQFIYDEFIEHPKYLEGAGLYELNDNRGFTGHRDGEASTLPLAHSCEVALAKQTVRFLRNEGEPRDRGSSSAPWLAWVSFSRPHQPYTPSEPFASMYPAASIDLPPTATTEKPEVQAKRKELTEGQLRKLISAYYGLVSQVDYGIGLILAELERSGELENTIIVYCSDHGDYAGEHGLIEKKGGISYRAITRVPLIVRLPAGMSGARGAVSQGIVESVDVFPTLCELAGLPIPNTVQGFSFARHLQGIDMEQTIRESAFTENAYRKALATRSWRYVANLHPEQKDELYSLDDDPWELNNRIDDPACAGIASELLRQLLDRTVKARKPINTINGGWHAHAYDRDGRIDLERSGGVNPYW
ncbi:sulfatase family protein [Paenibacillus cremeus]|uniref:Sulfatase-like hydrolase/transferase n=1 Tax=Paenibacillus cremeus TaxID=2163881 RepID=A0A559KFT7_9BACL|nr:sulfatase-like hydrolase/transferase [Paenibacillus cremeus]TVY10990.1 sulfatase-like hydrolase/transferase [Paenibacillus cremeus]